MAEDALPDVQPGQPISARLFNRLVAAIRRNTILDNAGGGHDIRRGPEGTTLTVVAVAADVTIRKAKAPAGGIGPKVGNVPGSAVCTFYTWDGTNEVLGSETATVFNSYPTSPGVAPNKDIWVVLRDRDTGTGSDWFELTEAC